MSAVTPVLHLLHPYVQNKYGFLGFLAPPGTDKAKQGPGLRFHLPTLTTKIAPAASAVTARQQPAWASYQRNGQRTDGWCVSQGKSQQLYRLVDKPTRWPIER